MSKRLLRAFALALPLVLVSSCMSGPSRLSRSWDDWVNQKYTESAWVHGALFQNIVPVYPLTAAGLGLIDVTILNPWYFWSSDAWDNVGTGFQHENPSTDEKVLLGAF